MRRGNSDHCCDDSCSSEKRLVFFQVFCINVTLRMSSSSQKVLQVPWPNWKGENLLRKKGCVFGILTVFVSVEVWASLSGSFYPPKR